MKCVYRELFRKFRKYVSMADHVRFPLSYRKWPLCDAAMTSRGCSAVTREVGQRTRDRLLVAALELLAQRGQDGVTLREITDAAEGNVAAVSYHFGSLKGFCDSAVEHALERYLDAQHQAVSVLALTDNGPASGSPRTRDMVMTGGWWSSIASMGRGARSSACSLRCCKTAHSRRCSPRSHVLYLFVTKGPWNVR